MTDPGRRWRPGFFIVRHDFINAVIGILSSYLPAKFIDQGKQMGRILIVAVACIFGALVTWLLVPTIQPAPVMQTAGADAPSAQPQERQAAATPMMSEEKPHARAEQLIGKQIKYVPAEKIIGAGWFREQETQVIERAMDECFLLTDKFLYADHVHALSDGGDEVVSDPAAVWPHPSLKQLLACKNVFTVYAELHGKTLDF